MQPRRGTLVLTEGVIPYLTNEEAASLADALHSMRHARFWIVDYLSARAVEFRRRGRVRRAMQNAPFKFAPGDWFAFFRQHGWRVKEIRYYPVEGALRGRPVPLPASARLVIAVSRLFVKERRLEGLRQFGGYAMLEPLRCRRHECARKRCAARLDLVGPDPEHLQYVSARMRC